VLLVFLASAVAGGFGSMVGIGGGIVIVPVLTVLLHHDIKVAIAASLIGVIATSISASSRYLQAGVADRRLGLVLLVATAAGGISGGLIGLSLDPRSLALLFGLLLVLVAFQMLRPSAPSGEVAGPAEGDASRSTSYREPSTGREVAYAPRRLGAGAAVSFLAGNVSGLLGVGGGIINVPTMNLIMRVPIRVATTTSTYMLGATAVASSVQYAASGLLDPLIAAPVALGVFVGARAGSVLAMRLSQRVLQLAFVAMAIVFALQMFARVIDPAAS
jgi:uncharacterized membrane protein YfcA